ncbi:hypothetical protein V8B97DRAFT_1919339 [Scleroderma yunnanense]
MSKGTLNVMIMGETGVGKSSVVNLIAGESIARVTPDLKSSTTSTTKHFASTDSMSIHIWEMTGFNQLTAPNGKVKLTMATTSIFRRVKEMFGDLIPIVLAILRRNEVVGTGHVCITGLQEEEWSQQCEQSQKALLAVLQEQYLSRQSRSIEQCFLEYLSRMQNFNQKGKKLEKVLKARYKLDPTTAERLTKLAAPAEAERTITH